MTLRYAITALLILIDRNLIETVFPQKNVEKNGTNLQSLQKPRSQRRKERSQDAMPLSPRASLEIMH